MHVSLIAMFSELTGWPDGQIAQLLGIPRSTVQAFRVGRLAENLTDSQRAKIIEQAQAYRQQVYEAVAQMELYS